MTTQLFNYTNIPNLTNFANLTDVESINNIAINVTKCSYDCDGRYGVFSLYILIMILGWSFIIMWCFYCIYKSYNIENDIYDRYIIEIYDARTGRLVQNNVI